MLNKIEVKKSLELLNTFLKENKIEGQLTYRAEVSHLVRAGRSQISLNVSEEGSKLIIDLYKGKKKISGECSGNLKESLEKFKKFIIDLHARIEFMPEVAHITELTEISQVDIENSKFDQSLVEFNSEIAVSFFDKITKTFGEEVEVSGAFSAGAHSYGVINTKVSKAVFYEGTDWNVEAVLQLINDHKKEIRVSSVGEELKDFLPDSLIKELEKTYNLKRSTPREDLEPGEYDIIFHADAFAELTAFMSWLTLYGESYEYESGMLQKENHKIGDKVFGKNLTITDNPNDPEILFAKHIGKNGVHRKQFPLITDGVLEQMFYSDKETCDRFSLNVNNDASVASIKVHKGNGPKSFNEMIENTKEKTIFIPFIHYMNITNSAKGEVTGTSRFGTFMIEDGKVVSHLYNLRINDSLKNIFNQIDWLSSELQHVNTSDTYDMRSSSSITCPRMVKVKGVKITGTSAV